MDVFLEPVPYEKKYILWNLMELYCYDFSEYLESHVNESGRFGYRYLDHYWTEAGRHPFLILHDTVIIGFVLVNQHLLLPQNQGGHSIAEFFILKRYRRKGLGQWALSGGNIGRKRKVKGGLIFHQEDLKDSRLLKIWVNLKPLFS